MQVSDSHSVRFNSLRPPWTAAHQTRAQESQKKKKKGSNSSSKKRHVGARINFSFDSD